LGLSLPVRLLFCLHLGQGFSPTFCLRRLRAVDEDRTVGHDAVSRKLSAVDHQPGRPLDISCHPPTIEGMKVGPADRRPVLTEME